MRPPRQIPTFAFSMDEVAQSIGVSKPMVYALIEGGLLRTFLIGKRRLATPEAITHAVRELERRDGHLPASDAPATTP